MTTYFDAIRAERLTINRSTNSLVWGRRGPGVQFLNANSAAKLSAAGTAAAVASSTGYLIGTATAAWEYRVNTGTLIRVGMATASRQMTGVGTGADVVLQELAVAEGNVISFALSTTALTITPAAPAAPIVISVTGFAAQTLYPWASNTPLGEEYSLTIRRTRGITMSVNATGVVEISTASAVDAAPLTISTGGAGLTVDGSSVGGAAPAPATAASFPSIPLTATVLPGRTIVVNISRVGNSVTLNWSIVIGAAGANTPSSFLSSAFVPAAMRPVAIEQAFSIVVLSNSAVAAGILRVRTTGEIEFRAGGDSNFTGPGNVGLIPGSVTWIAGV